MHLLRTAFFVMQWALACLLLALALLLGEGECNSVMPVLNPIEPSQGLFEEFPGELQPHLQLLRQHSSNLGLPLSTTLGRQLATLAGNQTGDTAGNCSCAFENGAIGQILFMSEFLGWMPLTRHCIYNFQRQLLAKGSRVVIKAAFQQFSSPSDLNSLMALNPDYSVFYYELSASYASARTTGFFSPAPTWSPAGSGGGSAAAAAAAAQTELSTAYFALYSQTMDILQSQPVMLVYRHDVLRAHNLSVPETWPQLLQMAANLNGTDFNGDGVGDYALCVDVDPNCKNYWLFSSLAASILQPNGTSSGFLVDPASEQHLIGSGGMMRALHTWHALMQYNSPEQYAKQYCGVWEDEYTLGRCAFTLGYAQVHDIKEGTYAYGRTGVAPTPGSTEVWDRARRAMVPCDAAACPFSVPLRTPEPGGTAGARVNRAPVIASLLNKAEFTKAAAQDLVTSFTSSATPLMFQIFNWPILALCGAYFLQNEGMRNSFYLQSFNTSTVNMTYYAGRGFIDDIYSWAEALRNQTSWDTSTLEPAVDPVLFLEAAKFYGHHPADASAHMRAWFWSVLHPNVAVDPQRMPGLRAMVADLVVQTIRGVDEQSLLADIAYKMGPNMWGTHPAFWTLEGYRADLGYRPPNNRSTSTSWTLPPASGARGPEDAPPSASSAGLSQPQLLLATVLPVLAALAAAAGLTALLLLSRSGLDMFGEVRAPNLGPGTTLVITDIQSSTALWELLPHLVMNAAVHVHHAALRGLLKKHKGYETCTEGDSFIIAFHTPGDALSYCLEAQDALNAADWPQEVLDMGPEAPAGAGVVQVAYHPSSFDWCTPLVGVAAPPERQDSKSSQQDTVSFLRRLRNVLMCRSPGLWAPRRPLSAPPTKLQLQSVLAAAPSMVDRPSPQEQQGQGKQQQVYQRMRSFLSSGASSSAELVPRLPTKLLLPPGPAEGRAELAPGAEAGAGEEAEAAAEALTLGQRLELQVQTVSSAAAAERDTPALGQGQGQGQQVAVVFRGLRVRMGLHSGLTNPQQWGLNKMTGRWCASGAFLAMAKASGDVGAGGMITLSASAMSALSRDSQPAGPRCVVLHLGGHQLQEHEGGTPVYCALPLALIARLALFPPMRSLRLLSPGVLSAPWGSATIVFMHAVGVKTLQAWNQEVAQHAVQVYQEVLTDSVQQWEGYIAELSDGLCLAAFSRPGHAIGWALSTQLDLLEQAWDPRLLKHELCEEVSVVVQASGSDRTSSMLRRHKSARPILGLAEPSPALTPNFHRASAPLRAALDLDGGSAAGGSPPSCLPVPATPSCLPVPATPSCLPVPATPSCLPVPATPSCLPVPATPSCLPVPATPGAHLSARDGEGDRDTLEEAADRPGPEPRREPWLQVQRKTVLRGLRVKVGMAMGPVNTGISPTTGAAEFRGKVMNRAARIAGLAGSSQVLCSSEVWAEGLRCPRLQALAVIGCSLGQPSLKGIKDKVEVIECRFREDAKTMLA